MFIDTVVKTRHEAAEEIRKMHGTRRSNSEKRFTRRIDMRELADSVAEQNAMRKMDHGTRMQKKILKAVKPKYLRMQANGIPASVRMFKLAHRQPRDLDPEMFTKLSLPAQSLNGISTDTPKVQDGARFASEVIDDEQTDLHTRPNVVGSQAITSIADSSNITATLDALKQDFARGAKPYLA